MTMRDLALDILVAFNLHNEDDFDIAARATQTVLGLLFKHGITHENIMDALTVEYTKINNETVEDFFK